MDTMRLIFAGTPDVAVPSLQALHAAGHEISLVLTQPDARGKRGSALHPSPVKRAALELGLEVATPERASDPETVERIASRVKVGNVYVNRNQIGAVVGVQPFGGQGLSGTGPKAGGPHYLPRFATEKTVTINTTAAGGNASLLTLGD